MGTRYRRNDLVTPVGESEVDTGAKDIEKGETCYVDFINQEDHDTPVYFLKPLKGRGLQGFKASNLRLVERREDRDNFTKWKQKGKTDNNGTYYQHWENDETGVEVTISDERDYGGGKIGFSIMVSDRIHDRMYKKVVDKKWEALRDAEKVRDNNEYTDFEDLELPRGFE